MFYLLKDGKSVFDGKRFSINPTKVKYFKTLEDAEKRKQFFNRVFPSSEIQILDKSVAHKRSQQEVYIDSSLYTLKSIEIEDLEDSIILGVIDQSHNRSYFLDTGEETVYKPVSRKVRSNDSDFRKFLLTADPKSPCIYAIRCKLNHMVYIGKTNNFLTRAKYHFTKLNEKNHDNNSLQEAWNTYGKHNFSIEVIEICSECELKNLETYYISKFGYRAYNVVGNKCNQL